MTVSPIRFTYTRLAILALLFAFAPTTLTLITANPPVYNYPPKIGMLQLG